MHFYHSGTKFIDTSRKKNLKFAHPTIEDCFIRIQGRKVVLKFMDLALVSVSKKGITMFCSFLSGKEVYGWISYST